MIRLPKSADAWGTTGFTDVLKRELGEMGTDQLPLQQGMSSGNHALDKRLSVMIISVADDPTPVEEQAEYCEIRLDIDKETAATAIRLLE